MAGNIRIIEPTENYQKVSKGIIFNRDIDALTLGIYVKVLCLGKEWELNIQGLAKALDLSEAKIKTAFSLMERAGYVKRIHIKDESNGRFLGFDYHISAIPFPEEERTDLVATHGRNEPNTPKTQRMENPTDGKSNGWKTQPMENREDIYRDNIQDRDNKPTNKDIKVPPVFDYRKSVIDLGVPEPLADAFMKVRKTKKAIDSEIAFNGLKSQIEKSGLPPKDCIEMCVINSWKGFRADWLEHRKGPYQMTAAQNRRNTQFVD